MAVTLNANTSTGFIATSDTSGVLQLQTGGTTAVTVDASQNVGIGTASPLTPLHVVGAIQSQRTGGVSQYARMVNSGGTATFISDNQASGTYTGFQFQGLSTASGTPTTYATIDGSGNVGIGTISPSAKLHVDSTTSGQMARFNSTAANGGYITGYSSGTGVWDLGTAIQAFATGSSTDVGLTSRSGFLGFGTASIERMRIDSSGVIKINRTTNSSIATNAILQILMSNSNNAIVAENTNATPFGIDMYYSGAAPNNTSSAFYYASDTGGARFISRSNGGIANYSANNVNLSDRREKTNFAPAKNYLNTICAIPVQTFNYVDQNLEEDGGLTLGVVAQDVQAVAPELVMESNWGTQDEPKMRLSIYQTDLQYALMKCIQEQQAIIQTLTDRITALEGTTP